MARTMQRYLLLLLPLARADPFALTARGRAALQAAASRVELPTAGSCTGEDKEPTDVEKDFAANPYFKYFTYDTYDKDTWGSLDGLEACMRSVKGHDWIKGADLWEDHKEIYRKLGETATPNQWFRQSWIEHHPVINADTVLGLAKNESAPISSMSDTAWEQQPCNAFSNAAFFEVSIQACSSVVEDFGGSWNYRDELVAAAALMAFGSFAMHGNPASGKYHEVTGSAVGVSYPVNENETNLSMPYDTSMFDRVSMDVLFFVLFQATVRCMAEDPTDPSLKPVIGLFEDPELAPLGCDNMYCDAREITRMYQNALNADTDQWYIAHSLRNVVPEYKLASAGLVLSSVRAIMSDELFGSAAMPAYTQLCYLLVMGLVPDAGVAERAAAHFCQKGSSWYTSMEVTKFRQVKDIAKSMATLVNILETLLEGMYWQESLVEPRDYLDDYLAKGVLNVSACWRQPHGNWHRVAAQMMKELLYFVTTDVYSSTRVGITAEQKREAWSSLNLVVSEFLTFVNALKVKGDATTVNLCRVFKLAKETAMSGNPPTHYQIMPMLDAVGLNQQLENTLAKQDPILDMDLNVNEDVRDPTGACNYKLTNVKIDEIAGLGNLLMQDFQLNGEYVEGSNFDSTSVKFSVGMKTCPLNLKVRASGEFILDGGKLGWACRRTVWRVEADLDFTFAVDAIVAWAQANFQKIFAGDATALSGGVDQVDLAVSYVELSRFDISNFPGEKALQSLVNSLLKTRLREELTKVMENKVKAAAEDAISSAMSSAGSSLPFGEERRRLATCPSNQGNLALDSAGGMFLSIPVMALIYSLL